VAFFLDRVPNGATAGRFSPDTPLAHVVGGYAVFDLKSKEEGTGVWIGRRLS
jgi:hypothetical protein